MSCALQLVNSKDDLYKEIKQYSPPLVTVCLTIF